MRREYRPDQPFPLWLVFPLLFTLVYLTHATLLRLPYYWDEAGYYIPAAYDFFRTGSLIPHSTLSNAHPPLPSVYLALWWWASGFVPMVTRIAMCIVASIALLGVYRLAQVVTHRTFLAISTVLLTALYPVWFAQSTLAHADMFAAAGTLWGLVFFFRARDTNRLWPSVLCFALACLSKETAVVTPGALAICVAVRGIRTGGADRAERRRGLLATASLFASALPLCCWYLYHWRRTGFIFGNPEYLRYNATATLHPLRILLAFAYRIFHITVHMNLFVPVLCGIAALLLQPAADRDDEAHPVLESNSIATLLAVILANLLFFSVLGGALLTRYLLPLYPLVLLLCVATFYRRVRLWYLLVGLSGAAFILGIVINPPYRFTPEDNLSYRDAILLHQEAIRQLAARYPSSTVLTAWPATDELAKPELGYVRRPFPVVAIEAFSLPQVQQAAALTEPYTTGLIFSTKYDPPRPAFSLGQRNDGWDKRFFDFHRDLSPQQVASLLDGTVVWEDERKGRWAAVLHFNRPQLAELRRPAHP